MASCSCHRSRPRLRVSKEDSNLNPTPTMKPLIVLALSLPSLALGAGKADLIRLYEEEILAHDLYVELGKIHEGIRPFANIPHSEARHREVMEGILKQEGIEIPTAPKGRRFTTDGLDKTYRRWLKEGRKNEVAACRVGVRLEEHDIADLRQAQQDFPTHKDALASLEAASNNHLRAFHRNLTGRGGKYQPDKLPAGDFTTIVNSPQQPGACGAECDQAGECKGGCSSDACGPGKAKGRNQGQGAGKGQVQGRGAGAGNGRGPGGPPAGRGHGSGRGPGNGRAPGGPPAR